MYSRGVSVYFSGSDSLFLWWLLFQFNHPDVSVLDHELVFRSDPVCQPNKVEHERLIRVLEGVAPSCRYRHHLVDVLQCQGTDRCQLSTHHGLVHEDNIYHRHLWLSSDHRQVVVVDLAEQVFRADKPAE